MIPTNVITGSLGAGKTTIILNLVKQYPSSYKLLWLKNEYGDVNIDTQLLNQSAIQTTEIMNGCLCCVLIGKLEDALLEISKNKEIDRLIIETAGTAYPYPIFKAVKDNSELVLDSLVKVVDCLNFDRIEDKSQMAKDQAEFIDLIVFNKHELVEKSELDRIEDEVYEIYPEVQKIQSNEGKVQKEVITGLEKSNNSDYTNLDSQHMHNEIDAFYIDLENNEFTEKEIIHFLNQYSNTDVYRIKGFVKVDGKIKFLNFVNNRLDILIAPKNVKLGLVFMGEGIKQMESTIMAKLKNKV